ncbi:hypothetical protein BDV98DRAFT_260897 [Pterulicium gracile]|uniref:Uncharacterized protein n=1 Tax=Pterulicium gracile TaxID=1884261 RepID=A0A5C3Q6A3_9AGAR|nr:hypothetical protein BDV98DRAFT_260897 [Pterula gracilis]
MPLHSEDLARMPLYPEYSSADAWPQNGLQAPFSADVYPSSETNFTSSGSFNQGYGDTTSFVGLPFLPPQDPVAHPQHEPGYPGHTNSSKFYGQDSSLTSYGRMLRMGSTLEIGTRSSTTSTKYRCRATWAICGCRRCCLACPGSVHNLLDMSSPVFMLLHFSQPKILPLH